MSYRSNASSMKTVVITCLHLSSLSERTLFLNVLETLFLPVDRTLYCIHAVQLVMQLT